MPKTRIAITIDRKTLTAMDRLVRAGIFASRSRLVEDAVYGMAAVRRSRLARECAKLDPAEEQALADEGSVDRSA